MLLPDCRGYGVDLTARKGHVVSVVTTLAMLFSQPDCQPDCHLPTPLPDALMWAALQFYQCDTASSPIHERSLEKGDMCEPLASVCVCAAAQIE